jgi:hypothetical protein
MKRNLMKFQADDSMKAILALLLLAMVGCSSTEPSMEEDLETLTQEFDVNRDLIAQQETEIVKLREQLRHDSAEIEVNPAQAQHLYTGPRARSPY